jgi:hypothetical protein
LVISCASNKVTITADNATTIEYNFDGSSTYTAYTEPFKITQTVTVYAKASNVDGSITASQECEYSSYNIPFYVEDISGSVNTVQIKKNSSNAPTLAIEKSTDGKTWASMGRTSTTAITATIPANGKLYLRCSAKQWGSSASYYNTINTTGNCNVGGNVMSLLYGSSFNGQTEFPNTNGYNFNRLFFNNTHVVNAENLLLLATTLGVYSYQCMFYGCTALTKAPTALPATTMTDSCYSSMFNKCSSLTTAPALPATTLAINCYEGMFWGCTSLTIAPELPVTTLITNCYANMFYGCSRLNYIKCLAANISASSCTNNWVYNVSSTGTFVKDPNMSGWTTGISGIPSGWTVQDA